MRIAVVAFAITAACGTTYAPTTDSAPTVTWYQDAAPIVAKHCMKCHQDGGIAPFSLTSYDDAATVAPQMMGQVNAKTMPPFNAQESPDCTPRFGWVDDPRLSAEEIKTLSDWVAGGAQAGTRVDIAVPSAVGLTGITQTLAPSTPWVASGSRDQFICTILDPQTSGAFVNG